MWHSRRHSNFSDRPPPPPPPQGEMARVSAARASVLTDATAAFAREQAANARARAVAWEAVLSPLADGDSAVVARSKKDVDDVAKRAEARARNLAVAPASGDTAFAAAGGSGGGAASSSGFAAPGGFSEPTMFAASGTTADDL